MLKANAPGGKRLSDDEVAAQAIGFLLAGSDTTSVTLSLTCYFLATNPEVQEKLKHEIDSVWTDEQEMPSYDTVRGLPYLDMVIAETLRLHPTGEAAFLFRQPFGSHRPRNLIRTYLYSPRITNRQPMGMQLDLWA